MVFQKCRCGVLLGLWTTHGTAEKVEVSLLRGRRVVSDATLPRLGRRHRRILMRPRAGHRFIRGRHTFLIRVGDHIRARHVLNIP